MNNNVLKGIIVSKGLTYNNVSNHLNISLSAFTRKMTGKAQFKHNELILLKKLLELNEEQMLLIFFDK